MKGNNVAHSKLRKVSCKGMRIIEKNGLDATIRDAQKKGLINLV